MAHLPVIAGLVLTLLACSGADAPTEPTADGSPAVQPVADGLPTGAPTDGTDAPAAATDPDLEAFLDAFQEAAMMTRTADLLGMLAPRVVVFGEAVGLYSDDDR